MPCTVVLPYLLLIYILLMHFVAYKRQSKRPVQSDTLSGQFCKTFGKSFINKLKREVLKTTPCRFFDFKRASDTLIHPPMLIKMLKSDIWGNLYYLIKHM
jgi:hypothetical protein